MNTRTQTPEKHLTMSRREFVIGAASALAISPAMPRSAAAKEASFGACPPPGDKPHHYQITVFAVDVDKLPDAKNDSASAALVGFDLHFHTLAKATLTGLYGR